MAITFTNIPQNGASFQKPLIYEFESDSELVQANIRILNGDGEEIGHKTINGVTTSGKIDIAPYVKRAATYNTPQSVSKCSLTDIGGSLDVQVEIEGTLSEVRRFIAAQIDLSKSIVFLTNQMLNRTMDAAEFDTLCLVNTTTTQLSIVIELCDDTYSCMVYKAFNSSEQFRQLAICISPQEFPDNLVKIAKYVIIKMRLGNTLLDLIEYEIRPNLSTARRIGWINEFGAPEYYTFPLRKSLLVESTRKHIESIWGREAAALESDNELKMISAYEPQKQLKALAKILSSPKVWLQQSEGQQAVCLTTERALLTPGAGMGFIEIDLRAAEKGGRLW